MQKKNGIINYKLIFIALMPFFLTFCKKNNDSNDKNTVIDIDGNVYPTVTIGEQTWMAENLKVTRYLNGDIIGTTVLPTIEDEISYKYQWAYNGDESIVTEYGRLYTWYAVTDIRNVCPGGWHIPNNDEWKILENYLLSNGYSYDGSSLSHTVAQSLASDKNWKSDTVTCAVGYYDPVRHNTTGFNAMPAGRRESSGVFGGLGSSTDWWSSDELVNKTPSGYCRALYYEACSFFLIAGQKNSGRSVRCIKN